MTAGLADAPKDLVNEIKRLEELFTVDTAKLKEITDHFVNELAKGERPVYVNNSNRDDINH
jgi:hexokinase